MAEALRWTAMLRGCDKKVAQAEADELMGTLELTDLGDPVLALTR